MKDRLLNFLLAFAAFLLVFNFFFPKPQQSVQPSGIISIHAAQSSLTVPKIPAITAFNNTSAPVSLDTCKDLEILKDYQKIQIDAPFASFCKTLQVPSGTGAAIDLSVLAPVFENPGKYAFKLSLSGSQSVAEVEMTDRGAIRTFFTELFYKPVLNLFVFLLGVIPGHSLGLAIIAITVLIRIVLLVPQHHMLVSSRRMQAIQSKVKEIQKKYQNDQAKVGMELMELYKREGVNPLGSCLPLAIQMPILIVLYWVVSGISDPTNRYFLYPVLSSFDPSTISTHFLGLDLRAVGGIAGAALAISVAALQWFQIKLSLKRNPTAQAVKNLERRDDGKLVADAEATALDPEFMNAFMLWGMPGLIAVSTYFFPAGVGLYWLIGTVFMLIQQPIANHIADRKAAK
jgi:YidC/Oxa1 family membrane protein insertase